jgi:hypothetical protein
VATTVTRAGWRSMRSAPKDDGACVFLYGTLLTYCIRKSDRGKPMGKTVAEGYRQSGRWWVGLYECLPTHWMPMPEPPTR